MADKNDEAIRKVVEGMDVPGFDRHMEEVMEELDKKCQKCDKERLIIKAMCYACLIEHIPKACRSYARKVVEELPVEDSIPTKYAIIMVKHVKYENIKAVISRLTDKEPT